MFRYRRRRSSYLKQIIVLIAIPLAISGVGYALFSQQLSINTDIRNVSYSSSQNLHLSYTKAVAPAGGVYQYNINPMTVTNKGSADALSWRVTFVLPADVTNFTCTNTGITCTRSGTTVTVINANQVTGFIPAGSTKTFVLSFRTANPVYTLENLTVSGTLAPPYVPMGGLTLTVTEASRTWLLGWRVTYTFRVTNNTGASVSAWRIRAIPNSASYTVNSMPTTVNYVVMPTELIITSKSALANGSSFQFNGVFTMSQAGWAITSYSVQGAP